MKKIIIDVDTGVDDAWGLFLLLSASRDKCLEVLAVTCTKGNTCLDYVVRNTQYLMATAGFNQVPIYRGAASGLVDLEVPLPTDYKSYFGTNGFGDVPLPEIELPPVKEENAIVAMNRLVEENKDEVTLVCFAPLTTVALATRTYANFANNVRNIVVMGGNYTALGNTTKCAEFNFHSDPEAAHIVLSSYATKLTLLPWETCFNLKTPFSWRVTEFPTGLNKVIDLLNLVEAPVMARGRKLGYAHYTSCDSLLAAMVLEPSIISDKFDAHAVVELAGYHTRGQIVIDHLHQKKHNITIVRGIDVPRFQAIMQSLQNFVIIGPDTKLAPVVTSSQKTKMTVHK